MAARIFFGLEDVDARLKMPRRYGLTEIRSPHYSIMGPSFIQDILETNAGFVDGLKFKGGSSSLMSKRFLKEVADISHRHGIYMSSGGWAEHVLQKGPSSFKKYVQDCKEIGFDILELNMDSLKFQEDDLLRLIRLAKNEGLRAKPQIDVRITDPTSIQNVPKEIDTLIRRAERFLEAGAEMIMIDAEGVTKLVDVWRTDVIAKMIERLGLQRIMFEADEPESVQWFVNRYGSGVNLFVDHSHILELESLRSAANRGGVGSWGYRHSLD